MMRRFSGLLCRASAAVLVCAGLPAAGIALSARAADAATNCTGTPTVTCTFTYTGARQSFTVPVGVTSVTIDAWGAQGAGDGQSNGGLGGHERATMSVTAGASLGVFVGERGAVATPDALNGRASFNGGGAAVFGGGGASDVRRAPEALGDRVVVAGGGGGVGGAAYPDLGIGRTFDGGAGGGPAGAASTDSFCGGSECGGGGSSVGGSGGVAGGQCPSGGSSGALGVGGSGCSGGGGGGWFGGGGGGGSANAGFLVGGGGGGGSGHVASPATATLEASGVRAGDGLVTISYTALKVPVGAVACPVSGTAKFTKPLTNVPSTKPVKMKLVLAGTGCDNSAANGGKVPITQVAVTSTLTLAAGATCSSAPLSTTPLPAQKIPLKWQGRNAVNKLITVGVTNTTANPFSYSMFVPFVPLSSPTFADPKKPFVGDHLASTLVVAESQPAQQTACGSVAGLVTVHLTGVIVAAP